MCDWKSDVWDAANLGDLHSLDTALASFPHLIDVPNPCDWQQRTPIRIAAGNGHAEIIEKLVDSGSQAIDTPDVTGWTPIFSAATGRHVSVIEMLVRLGSNAIDTPDNEGWTPIHAATSQSEPAVIETLVRLGSKAIDTPNNEGWTPMHEAAQSGHVSVIETLVRLGSQAINAPNNIGTTPMHIAVARRHTAAIETLVRLGSTVYTPNRRRSNSKPSAAIRCREADEDRAWEVRYRVYFKQSLVSRLLFELDRQHRRASRRLEAE